MVDEASLTSLTRRLSALLPRSSDVWSHIVMVIFNRSKIIVQSLPSNGFFKLSTCCSLAVHRIVLLQKSEKILRLGYPQKSCYDFLYCSLASGLFMSWKSSVMLFQGLIFCFYIIQICPCFIPCYILEEMCLLYWLQMLTAVQST